MTVLFENIPNKVNLFVRDVSQSAKKNKYPVRFIPGGLGLVTVRSVIFYDKTAGENQVVSQSTRLPQSLFKTKEPTREASPTGG